MLHIKQTFSCIATAGAVTSFLRVRAPTCKTKKQKQTSADRAKTLWKHFVLLAILSSLHFCSHHSSACQLYWLVAVHCLIAAHFHLSGVVITLQSKEEEVLINTPRFLLTIIMFIPIIMPKVKLIFTHPSTHVVVFISLWIKVSLFSFWQPRILKLCQIVTPKFLLASEWGTEGQQGAAWSWAHPYCTWRALSAVREAAEVQSSHTEVQWRLLHNIKGFRFLFLLSHFMPQSNLFVFAQNSLKLTVVIKPSDMFICHRLNG